MQGRLQVLGQRRLENPFLPAFFPGNFLGMKEKPLQSQLAEMLARLRGFVIPRIARDGMSKMRQVGADLMHSAGFDEDLQQGIRSRRPQRSITRHRAAAFLGDLGFGP